MSKKSMVLTLTLLLLPNVVLAWTIRAQMNETYPNIGGGIYCTNRNTSYAAIVADPTAPDPPNSLLMHMDENTKDGGEPAACFAVFNSLREIYFQYWFKYGQNHVLHPTLDKQVYFFSDNEIPPCDNFGNCGRMPRMFTGITGGEGNPQFALHFGGATSQYFTSNPYENGYERMANMNTSAAKIRKGVWYKVTGHIKFGSPGNIDAISEIWINDVQTHKYPNPATGHHGNQYLKPSDTGITQISIAPVWGGANNIYTPTGGMDMWFDDFILSTEPITGMKPIFLDPQQKFPNPPSKLQLN